MVRHLRRDGVCVGRRRLMRLMGLKAIYQAPKISTPRPEYSIYPYRLKGLTVERPDLVWCPDIICIPIQHEFLHLVAIIDWAKRNVLTWQLTNTMDARFCVVTLTEALAQYEIPEISNTDQGGQFTSFDFTGVLKKAEVTISVDDRGQCMDNILIERLWHSLKYEAVYFHELTDYFHAERIIGEWIDYYNPVS